MKVIKNIWFFLFFFGVISGLTGRFYPKEKEETGQTLTCSAISPAVASCFGDYKIPVQKAKIAPIYKRFRSKILPAGSQFLFYTNNKLFQAPCAEIKTWRFDQHLRCQLLLRDGTRAPPLNC